MKPLPSARLPLISVASPARFASRSATATSLYCEPDMEHPFPPVVEEPPLRAVARAWLDQLNLERPDLRIAVGEAEKCLSVGNVQLDVLLKRRVVAPRPDADRLIEPHSLGDVAHDDADVVHGIEDLRHSSLPVLSVAHLALPGGRATVLGVA